LELIRGANESSSSSILTRRETAKTWGGGGEEEEGGIWAERARERRDKEVGAGAVSARLGFMQGEATATWESSFEERRSSRDSRDIIRGEVAKEETRGAGCGVKWAAAYGLSKLEVGEQEGRCEEDKEKKK